MTEKRPEELPERVFSEGKTPELIVKFSLPTVVSLLINSTYNIVDQIFLGHGVGYSANAATNVVYPLTVLCLALAAWIGDGASAAFSLSLGRGEPERSARCGTTAAVLAAAAGIAVMLSGRMASVPLLQFLSAPEELMDMTMIYLRVTLFGVPALMLATVLTGLIRADGSPVYAMFCIIPGCIVNIILDYVFVFPFGWGIAGAAWATVIGQYANCLIGLFYLPAFRSVRLFQGWKLFYADAAAQILRLGSAGFANQVCGAVYAVVINRCLSVYGAQSRYGAEIPLAAYGIMVKVSQIAFSVMSGVAVGMQSLLGFHYGRRNYARVKECLRWAVLIVTCFGCILFVIFEFFPMYIVGLFGQSDALYREYAVKCFRIFLFAAPLFGFSIVSTGLFQAIGKPAQATFMALSRQVIYLVPLLLLFGRLFGVVGLLYASPVGDTLAFLTCLILYRREIRLLDREIRRDREPASGRGESPGRSGISTGDGR